MSVGTILAFVLANFVIIVIPGPSVLFVIDRSLVLGRRAGLLSVLGNEAGVVPVVFAVAFGVGAIVSASIAEARPPSASAGRIFLQGFIVGATNPKSLVFFVAVLPQFVNRNFGAIQWQFVELGLIFVFIALVSDAMWAIMAGSARNWFATNPKRMSRMSAVGGGMMIGLSGVLLLTGNKR